MASLFSLRKSKHVLRQSYHLFKRKSKNLSAETKEHLRATLQALQEAILQKNREKADLLAKETLSLTALHLKKNAFDQFRELIIAVVFALTVAILVRQMWFEPYEIPTGSMRPTLKEQDRLIVTKTNFGINFPLRAAHLYFNPDLVQRNGIFVFTGANMDIRDVDTMYFYIFPGKKQYIKRLMGKPGDILYFYGGEMYGIDKDGNDISPLLQVKQIDRIEHIPFIDFDRKIVVPPAATQGVYSPVFLYQMNEPIAKLSLNKMGAISGEVLPMQNIHAPNTPPIKDYFDIWGMKNFGMARILTKEQVKLFTRFDLSKMPEGLLYLEITHHPSFANAKLVRDEMGRVRPSLSKSTSLIPLQEQHLKAICNSMYTARFCVKNGIGYRYGSNEKQALNNSFAVHLASVPDGCYEFYYGKASAVKWQGITQELPADHPLYQCSPEIVQLLYNTGIEWDMHFMPQVKDQRLIPSRYAYFRNGDLYLLGAPIFKKDDPVLVEFAAREKERQAASSAQVPYFGFEDSGPPLLADGSLNKDFVRQYGLMISEKSYLGLGDNHAMSSDSREFGFIPESNMRGAPDFIFWPPDARWGHPNQPPYPFFNLPRTIVWILAAISIWLCTLYWRKRNKLPLPL
jgi:signal peptidase I